MTKSRNCRDLCNRNINYRAPFCLANFDFIVKVMNIHKKEKIQRSDLIKFEFYKHFNSVELWKMPWETGSRKIH